MNLPSIFADNGHRSDLRTFFTFFFVESHFRSHFQQVEISIENTIAVKINFTPVGGFEKPILFFGNKTDDARVSRRMIVFNFPSSLPRIVVELALRRSE